MTMNGERVYSRNPDAVSADLGKELAVLDIRHGSYRGFNETAAFVWRRLESPSTLTGLCKAVTGEFDVSEEACRASLGRLIGELEQAGLVVSRDG